MPRKKDPRHPRDFERLNRDEALQQVLDDFDKSKTFQQPFFQKFEENYRLYHANLTDEEKENLKDRASLFIPYCYNQVETMKSRIINNLVGTRPYVKTLVMDTEDEDAIEYAEKMDKLIDYQLNHEVKFVPKFETIIGDVLTIGNAITKQIWRKKEQTVRVKKPVEVEGERVKNQYETKTEEKTVYDDPDVLHIPIYDFFFDPTATSIEDSRYNIHRRFLDPGEAKQEFTKENGCFNYTKLDDVIDEGYDSEHNNQTYDNTRTQTSGESSKGKRKVEVLDYWTDEYKLMVVNRKLLVYKDINPYYHNRKPFAHWKYTNLPDSMYGAGLIDFLKDLQEELNTTRRQRIDNVSLSINNMWKALNSSNLTEADLVSKPNGVVWLDDMDDLMALEVPDMTSSAYEEEAIIKQDMDRTTGIFDFQRGESTQRRETATTVSILSQAGNERINMKLNSMQMGGFYETINQILELNKQFITNERMVIFFSEHEGVTRGVIEPDDIQHDFKLVAVGSNLDSRANKEVRQNQLIQLMPMLLQTGMVDPLEFIKRVLESFDFKDIDNLMRKPQRQQPSPEPQQPQDRGQRQVRQQQARPQQQQRPAQPQGRQAQMPQDASNVSEQQREQFLQQARQILGQLPDEVIQAVMASIKNGQPLPTPELEQVKKLMMDYMKMGGDVNV